MFDKILVANRGEIALRVFRTCREMGIRTVAVHSPVDASQPHVLAADEAVALAGDAPDESYLDGAQIIAAGRASGAQAIHPGYGFLSENCDFAAACAEAGLAFIGPPPEVLRAVGDKLEARQLATRAGVPITPGTVEPSADLDELKRAAGEMGYPIMLKAAAGGGGKGMRRVDSEADLAEALHRAASEAQAAFGDGRLFAEKLIDRPRHVEVQILADGQGGLVHLFERECSIQRRHQKIIEEAPCPALDAATRQAMCDAALAVARAAAYVNAGTVEFLLAPDGAFYFMEVNARLQVEHPVTEAICGLDLVRHQIEVAAGLPLPFDQAQVRMRGQAIECRIYAEDPLSGFMPSPGRLHRVVAPQGPGVRFDCGVESGSEVPVQYDPILAKLTTWGADRAQARRRMERALADTVMLGVATPIALLSDIIASEAFGRAETDTGFIQAHFADWQPGPDRLDPLLAGWLIARLEGLDQATGGPPHGAEGERGPADPWQTLGRFRLEED